MRHTEENKVKEMNRCSVTCRIQSRGILQAQLETQETGQGKSFKK